MMETFTIHTDCAVLQLDTSAETVTIVSKLKEGGEPEWT